MVEAVSIESAQARLPDLIHKLGEGDELAITEGNKVVARLVREPHALTGQRPGPGLCKDMMSIVADDDEHLRDFEEYMP